MNFYHFIPHLILIGNSPSKCNGILLNLFEQLNINHNCPIGGNNFQNEWQNCLIINPALAVYLQVFQSSSCPVIP